MSKLILRYSYDDSFLDPTLPRDDFGHLAVEVSTDRFSGRGSFWVQLQDVKEFGESLGKFPLRAEEPIVAQWGYNLQEGDDLVIHLEVTPADKRGNLAVRFEVADPFEPRNRVRGSYLTNYPHLDAFRTGIALLMKGEVEEAILTGQ